MSIQMTTDRATCWSLTINNPTPQDEEYIALMRQKGWKVDGQLERGDQGTLHYQLMLRTPQVRFSQVKKACPRAHIEPARNQAALTSYVQKADTAVAPLSKTSELYPSLSKVWDLISEDYLMDPPREVHGRDPGGKRIADARLEWFDDQIRDLIVRGFHVETMAVNPQVRCCVAKFLPELMARSHANRRQTDRQPELFSHVEFIPQDAHQEANAPLS